MSARTERQLFPRCIQYLAKPLLTSIQDGLSKYSFTESTTKSKSCTCLGVVFDAAATLPIPMQQLIILYLDVTAAGEQIRM
jgi:hypothetical protein